MLLPVYIQVRSSWHDDTLLFGPLWYLKKKVPPVTAVWLDWVGDNIFNTETTEPVSRSHLSRQEVNTLPLLCMANKKDQTKQVF